MNTLHYPTMYIGLTIGAAIIILYIVYIRWKEYKDVRSRLANGSSYNYYSPGTGVHLAPGYAIIDS